MLNVITITTINKPTFIEDICENINKYEHKNVSLLIIGDVKTPPIKTYCRDIQRKYGVKIEYLDLEAQNKLLPEKLLNIFPLNTPDRVILGGMLSYLRGCERIIAVDDDNFMTDSDFVGFHSIAGTETELCLVESKAGWFNVQTVIEEKNNIPFYSRGYPWSKKSPHSCLWHFTSFASKVIVNQGLVLGEPDIDAIAKLANPICGVAMRGNFPEQFGLYSGTWSPFNFQNTCLSREMIPLYFRPRIASRNSDIWTAYLFNKLAEHFGDVITFGKPLVNHVRNPHNLWDDLDLELENNKETDYFIEILRRVKLTEKTYISALRELINESQLICQDCFPEGSILMINGFFNEYQLWLDAVSEFV